MSEQYEGFVAQSPAFRAYYGGYKAFFNEAEDRILFLDDMLEIGVKPWEWDHKRYGEKNKDMIGFFYNDDLQNIRQLRYYKMKQAASRQR